MGQTGTCPEALESLKVKSFYGDFADGFWNLGEWDSVVTGRQALEVPYPHAVPEGNLKDSRFGLAATAFPNEVLVYAYALKHRLGPRCGYSIGHIPISTAICPLPENIP